MELLCVCVQHIGLSHGFALCGRLCGCVLSCLLGAVGSNGCKHIRSLISGYRKLHRFSIGHTGDIREEVMDTQKYLSYFFPFEKPDFFKNRKDSLWNINGDRTMIALAMTFRKEPEAQVMCFMRNYAERYDWLEQTFQDWSFTFLSSFLFYEEEEEMDEDTRNIYRQGMAAFGGIAPNYHIELWGRPTIVWDFHSLLLAIQMMFSFMLADETSSLRLCKYCMKAFLAKSDDEDFCSPAYEAIYEKENEK